MPVLLCLFGLLFSVGHPFTFVYGMSGRDAGIISHKIVQVAPACAVGPGQVHVVGDARLGHDDIPAVGNPVARTVAGHAPQPGALAEPLVGLGVGLAYSLPIEQRAVGVDVFDIIGIIRMIA